MAKATGNTHSAASAMRQSNTKRLMEIKTVEIMEPASSGIKWEKLCSKKVQSAMMVLVRSARSFFPKKDKRYFPQPFSQRNPPHAAFRIGGKIRGVVLKVSGKQDQADTHRTADDIKDNFFTGNAAVHQIGH